MRLSPVLVSWAKRHATGTRIRVLYVQGALFGLLLPLRSSAFTHLNVLTTDPRRSGNRPDRQAVLRQRVRSKHTAFEFLKIRWPEQL